MYQFSASSMKRMVGVNDQLIAVFLEAIKVSLVDFGIPKDGGKRTETEQNFLYNKKVSNCDGINDISNHQTGNALDFYAYVNGKASWNKVHLALIASCILTVAKRMKKEGLIDIELKWGGTFGSNRFQGYDYPHIEIVKE